MRYFGLIFIILGLSCQTDKESTEIEVIKSTLLDVIDTLYYREPPPPPPQVAHLPDSSELFFEISIGPYLEDETVNRDSLIRADTAAQVSHNRRWLDSIIQAYEKFDWEQYRKDSIKWANSLNEPRLKKRIVLQVFDSLLSNQRGRINEIANLGFKKDFEIELEGELAALLTQLQDSTSNTIHIDFENFSSIGRYQIEPESYEPTDNDRVVATLVLSRVVFNSERTRSAYYYQEHCGLLCGYGYVVFAERTSNGWKVIGKNMVWIS